MHAVNILETIRDEHANEPLGKSAAGLLVEIEADRETLRRLVDRIAAS